LLIWFWVRATPTPAAYSPSPRCMPLPSAHLLVISHIQNRFGGGGYSCCARDVPFPAPPTSLRLLCTFYIPPRCCILLTAFAFCLRYGSTTFYSGDITFCTATLLLYPSGQLLLHFAHLPRSTPHLPLPSSTGLLLPHARIHVVVITLPVVGSTYTWFDSGRMIWAHDLLPATHCIPHFSSQVLQCTFCTFTLYVLVWTVGFTLRHVYIYTPSYPGI